MIRRFIGQSEVLLSVIGIDATALLTADEPQAVLDAAAWAGVDWMQVAATVDAAALQALLTACPQPPRCLLAAGDADAYRERRGAFDTDNILGGLLPACPDDWRSDDGLLVLANPEPRLTTCAIDAPQARLIGYDCSDGRAREDGLLDDCFAAGIGAIASDPLHGLGSCPDGLDPDRWQEAMGNLDRLAEQAESDRFGLAIGVLQATPGMTACLLPVSDPQAAAALADYGSPAKSKLIDKCLRTIAWLHER